MTTIRARHVPEAQVVPFVPFVRPSAVPLYRQIYDAYRSAILTGRLRPGQRLPSTRALADELEISRLPAVNAFEQLLHEGYIEGRVGAGSYVAGDIPDDLTRAGTAPGPAASPSSPPTPRDEGGMGPFRVSMPALDHFPHRVWGRLLWRHGKRQSSALMAYGDPAGYVPLREAIAEYLGVARGVRCDAAHVLIVSGSQMALQLCAMALLAPGDAVCVEEPGYPGARDALRTSGATVVPIPLDAEGIDVRRLAAQGRRARLVYVTPSHQYPLGISMTAARRLALLAWARGGNRWIVEDDYDSEYRYASRPLGALQGMDRGARVIYVGTFSKVLLSLAAGRATWWCRRAVGHVRPAPRGARHFLADAHAGRPRRLPARRPLRSAPPADAQALSRPPRRSGRADSRASRRRPHHPLRGRGLAPLRVSARRRRRPRGTPPGGGAGSHRDRALRVLRGPAGAPWSRARLRRVGRAPPRRRGGRARRRDPRAPVRV